VGSDMGRFKLEIKVMKGPGATGATIPLDGYCFPSDMQMQFEKLITEAVDCMRDGTESIHITARFAGLGKGGMNKASIATKTDRNFLISAAEHLAIALTEARTAYGNMKKQPKSTGEVAGEMAQAASQLSMFLGGGGGNGSGGPDLSSMAALFSGGDPPPAALDVMDRIEAGEDVDLSSIPMIGPMLAGMPKSEQKQMVTMLRGMMQGTNDANQGRTNSGD